MKDCANLKTKVACQKRSIVIRAIIDGPIRWRPVVSSSVGPEWIADDGANWRRHCQPTSEQTAAAVPNCGRRRSVPTTSDFPGDRLARSTPRFASPYFALCSRRLSNCWQFTDLMYSDELIPTGSREGSRGSLGIARGSVKILQRSRGSASSPCDTLCDDGGYSREPPAR